MQPWLACNLPPHQAQTLPLDDKLNAVAGFQNLPKLGNSKAVGSAKRDAFRKTQYKQLLGVHQELGVGYLDWLRGTDGFGCKDMAAVRPPGASTPVPTHLWEL